MRLKNRDQQIPGGFKFRQAQIAGWQSPPWVSFNVLVEAVIKLRKANPAITAQYSLSTDPAAVANEVDAYNAALCAAAGHTNYLAPSEGIELPKTFPPQWVSQPRGGVAAGDSQPSTPPGWFKKLGNVATGFKTLADWLGHEGKPVDSKLAESRAKTCSTCPKNLKGDMTSFFTKPASELIRRQLEERNAMKLATSYDETLGVCDGCGCPLKLKVHCPVDVIVKHMPKGGENKLVSYCWILSEKK